MEFSEGENTVDNIPALYGGQPMFKGLLPIIRPTLVNPSGFQAELKDIFDSGCVTVSRYVKQFEERCACYLGVSHVVAVSSATSGLILAVRGLGLKGEVIVPSFTFTATVHALVWNGVRPVFVDCEEGTYNIDVRKIEEKITPRTSAILPVYIFGNPPDVGPLQDLAKRRNLKLMFDSAQAFGAEYQGKRAGGFGNCEVFSLSPTKVLSSLEGGLVTTNDGDLAEFLRRARDYGKSKDGSDIDFVGLSARMSEVHALVGLKNMDILEDCLLRRKELHEIYRRLLSPLPGIRFQEMRTGNKSSNNYTVLFIDEGRFGMSRDELYKTLAAENIQTKKYFHPAVHEQKAYQEYSQTVDGPLPVTEKASREGIALPLYGHMEAGTVEKVCQGILRAHAYLRWRSHRWSRAANE